VWPPLRRVLLGFAAGLVLVGAPADAQIRPNEKDPKYFRWSTRRVTITVEARDFVLGSGTATIRIPRAIIGYVRPRRAWTMTVRADPVFVLKGFGVNEKSEKSCASMAIRQSGGAGVVHQLTTFDQVVASGPDIRGRQEVAFDISFTAYLTDVAGEYSIELYFQYENN
jgi:hypothetical protein